MSKDKNQELKFMNNLNKPILPLLSSNMKEEIELDIQEFEEEVQGDDKVPYSKNYNKILQNNMRFNRPFMRLVKHEAEHEKSAEIDMI